jgi:hypothetical protein
MSWFRVYFTVSANRQVDVEFVNGSPLGELFWNPDITEPQAQRFVEAYLRSLDINVLVVGAEEGDEIEIGPVVRLDTATHTPSSTPTDGPLNIDAAAVRGAG